MLRVAPSKPSLRIPTTIWKSINSRKRARSESPSSDTSLGSTISSNDANDVGFDDFPISRRTSRHTTSNTQVQSVSPSLIFEHQQSASENDYKIAIDFGTTFSTVAYVCNDFNGSEVNSIGTIDDFPKDSQSGQAGRQVPSESWYPACRLTEKRQQDKHISSPVHNEDESANPRIDDAIFQLDGDVVKNYNDAICPEYLHGWEVQEQLSTTTLESFNDTRLSCIKLLLDESTVTHDLRTNLHDVVGHLKRNNVINKFEDVIQDYLTVLLLHTRRQLEDRHGFRPTSTVEVVICVPVCWSPSANAIMCECLTVAMQRSGLGITQAASVPRLFLVNEAEAAATYALRAGMHTLERHETFVLLDCGGGTVDTGTYRVAEDNPLRLAAEVTNPAGARWGSSYLNEKMRDFALRNLRDETYLEHTGSGDTVQTIVDRDIMPRFEESIKRTVRFSNPDQIYVFRVPGLKESKTNPCLVKNALRMTHADMFQIFEPCFLGIARLMENQILSAWDDDVNVEKVVLMGGFADSLALRRYLQHRVKRLQEGHHRTISLVVSERNSHGPCATGVAKGGLLRALDKTRGPLRVPRMSFGLLIHLPYQPEVLAEYPHLYEPTFAGKPKTDPQDGTLYIDNTIQWVIKAGQGPIQPYHSATNKVKYDFVSDKDEWTQTEDLYVSETCVDDFFQKKHKKNKGKFKTLGQIVLNLNDLKRYITPTLSNRKGRRKYFRVEVLIEITVIDRDLKFNVRWPAEESGRIIEGSQRSFSVVAAFQPGTGI
ncbi:hypothetical protein K491DRAFT_656655 [Lophiostoma macrostomum CBS 122681]|uniref:Actin-like ATPase domain-containing protein n=1 Tax=Lophiostoma macrostomum CBS 122681 TaxID=1314788 RepID=A0A6A6TAS9_9PLEO|nr:hypothetical protein K491DRAFT_656655 [Lophiostoma macrostomum CBS 122681]